VYFEVTIYKDVASESTARICSLIAHYVSKLFGAFQKFIKSIIRRSRFKVIIAMDLRNGKIITQYIRMLIHAAPDM
jgi:hypothetical protein